jgi:maleylpyruvate isomerase
MAILEYLEDSHPHPPILPKDAQGRARVRELAQIIACDIHPVNNLRVLRYLVNDLGLSQDTKAEWYRHWLTDGLAVLEKHLARDPSSGPLCHGYVPTLADCCLVPQVYNAERHGIDVSGYPNISRIYAMCNKLPAFIAAHPSNQPDSE